MLDYLKKILILVLTFFTTLLHSQISMKDFKSDPYEELQATLKDKRIVLLGEQTHGDGAVFDEKVKIIKHLHENLNFDLIVMESGLYDLYKAAKLYSEKQKDISIYNEAVGEIWSDTKAFQNLLDYVDNSNAIGRPIKILGFDSQEGFLFNEFFFDDFKKLIAKYNVLVADEILKTLERILISKDFNPELTTEKSTHLIFDEFQSIANALKAIEDFDIEEKLILQVFISQISDSKFVLDQIQKENISVQNPRDIQMADNLSFISKLYPQKKIICWGASYHFARNIDKIDFSDKTKKYMFEQDSLNKNAAKTSIYYSGDQYNGENPLIGGIPMGHLLSPKFKEQLYSIAFTSSEGSWGIVGETSIPIQTPPENSIENLLAKNKIEKAFIDLDKSFPSKNFYCSAFGYVPFRAQWNTVFDGLFFIKKSYPPEHKSYGADESYENKEDSPLIIKGKVSDIGSGEPLINADISILEGQKWTKTNRNGQFVFEIPQNSLNKTIVFSAMGYKNDTIKLANSQENLEIKMFPKYFEGITLNEVEIVTEAKKLSAKEILNRVKENLENNYYSKHYSQKFYYRYLKSKDNENVSGEEAVLQIYNPRGMKASNYPDQKIFGKIINIRNIGEEELENNVWDRFGNVSLMFNRDLILSKANVLYRTSSYSLKKEAIVGFNKQKAYKIHFENTSPGSHSTGYGYPAPEYSSGYLYIDVDTYAVLQYEHCVSREPYFSKKNPDNQINLAHKIFVTYKNDENHYFVDHAQVTDETKIYFKGEKDSLLSTYVSTRDLISTTFEKKNITLIKKPLHKVTRPKKISEDLTFWEENNYLLLDQKLKFNYCN